MNTEIHPLTERLLQQARETFRQRCYTKPPKLRDLFELAVDIGVETGQSLSPERVLEVLQEHPEWVHMGAHLSGQSSIAEIVANQLARLIRQMLNDQWAVLLLTSDLELEQRKNGNA